MIISNIPNLSSMSTVKAKVDLYNGPTLVKTCTCGDFLSDFTVTREGDNSKFFGFGVCHKLAINFIDIERELNVTKGNTAEIGLGDGGELWDAPYPTFYITELERDEKTNIITGTAYDRLYWSSEYLFTDLGLVAPYSLVQVAQAVATKLGLTLNIDLDIYSAFRLTYTEGANIDEGNNKDLRTVLNWIAEATQSIYYVNSLNELVFKRLERDGEAVAHITKDDYYELNTKTVATLTTICNATELGENLEASTDGEGVTQYIRNNPFLELRDDLATLLDGAIAAIGGITITPFSCEWTGNYLLEIGDKLALTTEDDNEVYSYLLSDTVNYAGTYDEVSEWEYADQSSETYANPTNIGEKINQTFAKVDKVNKQIELLISDVAETTETVASLTLTTNAIDLLVKEHEEKIEAFEELETGQIVDRMAQIELSLDGIETTVSSNTAQIQTTNTEVAGVKQTVTSNTTRIGTIETNIDSINLSVKNQSTKITTLEATTQNQGTAIDGLTEDVSGLTETTEEHKSQIAQLQVDTKGIEATVSNNTSQINTVKDNVSELETTTETHANQIAALRVRTDEISATVSSVSEVLTSSTDNIEQQISSLTKEVSTKVSAEDLTITVRSELENGVDHVTTQTGFTFNETGLTVEKAGKEMKTQITEDGMTVYRDATPVLTANNAGVDATNLRASTYIIIGNNSRFENFGNSRTACFWIGE